jgi:hypothetical protein
MGELPVNEGGDFGRGEDREREEERGEVHVEEPLLGSKMREE